MAFTANIYAQARADLLSGKINFANDIFKVALLGNQPFSNSDLFYQSVNSTELQNQFGYQTGGSLLTNQKINTNLVTGEVSFNADNLIWTANGGALGPIYKAVIYDITYQNRLIAMLNFNAPNVAADGANFSIQWNASGIISFTSL